MAAGKVRKSHALAKQSRSGEAVVFFLARQLKGVVQRGRFIALNVKTITAPVEHNAERDAHD